MLSTSKLDKNMWADVQLQRILLRSQVSTNQSQMDAATGTVRTADNTIPTNFSQYEKIVNDYRKQTRECPASTATCTADIPYRSLDGLNLMEVPLFSTMWLVAFSQPYYAEPCS